MKLCLDKGDTIDNDLIGCIFNKESNVQEDLKLRELIKFSDEKDRKRFTYGINFNGKTKRVFAIFLTEINKYINGFGNDCN